MSVTLASRAATEPSGSDTVTPEAPAPHAALAATRATTFLRAQAQWLERGLLHGQDRVAVDIVLGAHDRSHDRWVATIRLVAAELGNEAANAIATVYSYMGRIAGSLDVGAMEMIDSNLAVQVRQFLADKLGEVTESAVETLWAAAAAEA